ncbi:MAG TPA: hypothetical protein VMV22_12540 [Acidimicrobiales bacterium]|nr:hypothetical protein [Acidimicrobiales bacterium]
MIEEERDAGGSLVAGGVLITRRGPQGLSYLEVIQRWEGAMRPTTSESACFLEW